jgi:hypothetical protein
VQRSDARASTRDAARIRDAAAHDVHMPVEAAKGLDAAHRDAHDVDAREAAIDAGSLDAGAPDAGSVSLSGLWFFDSVVGYAGPAAHPDNPSLTGGCVAVYWNQVETSPSEYAWTELDQKIAAWVGAGKPFCLRINGYTAASGYGGSPGTTPMWLLDDRGPLYNLSTVAGFTDAGAFGPGGALATPSSGPHYVAGEDWPMAGARYLIDVDGTVLPIWWDQPYLTAYGQFVQAIHDHLVAKNDPRWLPSWIQLGTGHAGETYLSKNSVANPVSAVSAKSSVTSSTLAVGTYYLAVLPVYGIGGAGEPPEVADGFGRQEAMVTLAANHSIDVTWGAPAVTTPAPLNVTGYLVWWGTAPGQEQFSAYVAGAGSVSFTISGNATSSVWIDSYNTEGSGVPRQMWNLGGAAGDTALMGNGRFTANLDPTVFLPEVAAAIASDQGAIFADIPCMVLVVNNPGGAMYQNVTNAVLAARANTFVQSDGLTQAAPAPNATELMQSESHGFAVYEEKAPVAMTSDLLAEATNAVNASVHVVLVFETECNEFSPSSPTYSAGWADAAVAAETLLRAP